MTDEAMREAARQWLKEHFYSPYQERYGSEVVALMADFGQSAYLRGRREGMEEILKLASDWEKFPYANILDIVKEIRAKLAEEAAK